MEIRTSKMEIKRYESSLKPLWDDFVEVSRQGTFLLKRDYMDYHADRFADFSLMAFDGGKLKAVLPANRRGDEVFSHQGLTYGGWLTPMKGFDGSAMLGMWDAMMEFFKAEGIVRLHYKTIPWIYARCGADDDRYALFRWGARMETCQVSSVINLREPMGFDSNARRNAAKARREGVAVAESGLFCVYWPLLTEVLLSCHNVNPVHTLDEIELLASRFPKNVRLYMATDADGEPLAGVVMYYSEKVAHAQYIASSEHGKRVGALALLFEELICSCEGVEYFDFGISCEQGGAVLNSGLLRQKSGFGGRGVTYESFVVDVP